MKKVGVMRGGISDQYDFSLQTGAEVARAVQDAGFEAIDMLLDKDGVLHLKGIPADLEKIEGSVDMVWNALHGDFGEDGKVQELFDNFETNKNFCKILTHSPLYFFLPPKIPKSRFNKLRPTFLSIPDFVVGIPVCLANFCFALDIPNARLKLNENPYFPI